MKKTALICTLVLAAVGAQADPRDHEHDRSIAGRMVYDTRYHHDHYYPAVGFVAPGLPRGSLSIGFGGGSYWFSGGVWYQPWARGFRVIVPPVGILVPLLPLDYVTLRIGGAPYYYANGVYYSAAPGGYVVVNPPPQADGAVAQPSPPPAPPRPDPIFYPRNGQSPQQQGQDKFECHNWAKGQTGFDPTSQASSGASPATRSAYGRAMAACLDARGYTVR